MHRSPPRALLRAVPTACATALLAAALGSCSGSAAPDCEVAAAASLRPLADDLAAALARATPPCRVRVATAASGTLAQQIRRGAPFALLLAADLATAETLATELRAPAGDLFAYARGSLVLWTRADLAADLQRDGLRALAAAPIEHLAIANPEVAPYGRAAMQALQHVAIADGLAPRLVRAENAAQAAHFARSGAADAALLPGSLAAQLGGHCWPVPADHHEPILHAGLVLARQGPERAAAEQVRHWLASPEGQQCLAAHGLLPPQ